MPVSNIILKKDPLEASRDRFLRREFTESQIIKMLKDQYKTNYFADSPFDAWDQLLVQESLAESHPVEAQKEEENGSTTNEDPKDSGERALGKAV